MPRSAAQPSCDHLVAEHRTVGLVKSGGRTWAGHQLLENLVEGSTHLAGELGR